MEATVTTTPAGAGTGTTAVADSVKKRGYNVQTAAGDGKTVAGIPTWLTGLTGLFTTVAALVLWRGGARARGAHS
ncbi:hypothetical protein M1D88_12910 [Arthrobacter sp. R1-13]